MFRADLRPKALAFEVLMARPKAGLKPKFEEA